MASWFSDFIHYRWRVLAAAAAGLVAGVMAARTGTPPGSAGLIGWNVAAVLFLIPTWAMLLFDGPEKVRARADREDENRAVMMGVVLGAVAVSLAAIVFALRETHQHGTGGGGGHPNAILALCASTLVLSWLVVQSLFAMHYAHRYFGRLGDGVPPQGLEFPGDAPSTYRDFVYVAICVGATCQVSDFGVTTARFRSLVTVHALIAFVFNTMVLALGINILGNLMGQ